MWKKVAKLSDFDDSKHQIIQIGSSQIALFRVREEIFAIDNICPHQGGPLGEGYLDGNKVTCPWHAWTFDVVTGKCLSESGPSQKTYKVKLEGNNVLIDVT